MSVAGLSILCHTGTDWAGQVIRMVALLARDLVTGTQEKALAHVGAAVMLPLRIYRSTTATTTGRRIVRGQVRPKRQRRELGGVDWKALSARR